MEYRLSVVMQGGATAMQLGAWLDAVAAAIPAAAVPAMAAYPGRLELTSWVQHEIDGLPALSQVYGVDDWAVVGTPMLAALLRIGSQQDHPAFHALPRNAFEHSKAGLRLARRDHSTEDWRTIFRLPEEP